MKRLALSLLFCVVPVTAQAADSAWVQATASGYEARIVTEMRQERSNDQLVGSRST